MTLLAGLAGKHVLLVHTALLHYVVPTSSEGPEPLRDPTEQFNQAIKAITFLCQELFAGFACTTLYAASVASDKVTFLENYQDRANETRRLMFVLVVISLVGATDQLVSTATAPATARKPPNLTAAAWVKSGLFGF